MSEYAFGHTLPALDNALTIVVHGTSAPQGSKSVTRQGFTFEQNRRTRPWRSTVTDAAIEAAQLAHHATTSGPVAVDILFTFARPSSHYGTGRNSAFVRESAPKHPMGGAPDVDKLSRAVLDALSDALIWRNDAQVTRLSTRKRYGSPGAVITVHDDTDN